MGGRVVPWSLWSLVTHIALASHIHINPRSTGMAPNQIQHRGSRSCRDSDRGHGLFGNLRNHERSPTKREDRSWKSGEVMWKCAFEISRQNLRQSQWSAYSLNVGHQDSCSALGTSQRTNVGPSLTRHGLKGRRPTFPRTTAPYCAAHRALHQKDKPGKGLNGLFRVCGYTTAPAVSSQHRQPGVL